jgi:hypothetical protein
MTSFNPFVLSEVEGRIPNAVGTCFDFAQHERMRKTVGAL